VRSLAQKVKWIKDECKGLKITELNYLEVYTYDKWHQQTINGDYRLNEIIPSSVLSICMQCGSTTRPDLLSEPELIGTMDKNQIGSKCGC
jgi:DNA topoisomerase-3